MNVAAYSRLLSGPYGKARSTKSGQCLRTLALGPDQLTPLRLGDDAASFVLLLFSSALPPEELSGPRCMATSARQNGCIDYCCYCCCTAATSPPAEHAPLD